MLSYRFPAAYQNKGRIAATLEGSQLSIADGNVITLGKFIGSGTYGAVFLNQDNTLVIKFEVDAGDDQENMDFMMDLNHWASEFDVGPKFGSWGVVSIDRRTLQKMKSAVTGGLPDWMEQSSTEPIFYSVYEKWDGDLQNWLEEGNLLKRLYSIPRPVMERFAERIRKLHRRAVAHLDLVPKNILIRVKNDVVEEMVLADFGIAKPRVAWFFDGDAEFRDNIVDYYENLHESTAPWAVYLNKQGINFAQYIQYEPFNADWCLVAAYALGTGWDLYREFEKMPPMFEFDFPWSENGWLSIVITDGTTSIDFDVHRMMSLFHLRRRLLEQGGFNMKRLGFTSQSGIISLRDEKHYYPSEVIVLSKNALTIKLIPRVGKK